MPSFRENTPAALTVEKARAEEPERREGFENRADRAAAVSAPENDAYPDAVGSPASTRYLAACTTMYRGRFLDDAAVRRLRRAKSANERYHYCSKSVNRSVGRVSICPRRWASTPTAARPRRGRQGRRQHRLGARHGGAAERPAAERHLDVDDHQRTAPVLLCLYAAVGEKNGVPMTALSGTVQNDVPRNTSHEARTSTRRPCCG